MGRLSHDPHIQHFSHPHLLELTNPQTLNTTTPYCSACKLQSSGWMYTCKPCNFTLHVSCTQMPQLITHPSHPAHSLSLLTTPIYPGGLFNCDGCGRQGHGFSYHCYHCNFDLHILCASKPLILTHQTHNHQLMLTFDPPYQTKGFSCDICRKIGSNHWLYRCSLCEFDAHLDCVAQIQTQQVHIQHYNSFPGANQMQYGNSNRPVVGVQYVHSQSMGTLPVQNNYQASAAAAGPGTIAMVQGIVQGVVQSLMNDGGNGGGNNSDAGNNGGDSSIMDIGSSIVNGIFGDFSGSQS